MGTTITILIIGVVFFLMIFLLVYQIPLCEEWEDGGYFAKTKMRNSYFLSNDLEEATRMYDGLIVREKVCVKTNKD